MRIWALRIASRPKPPSHGEAGAAARVAPATKAELGVTEGRCSTGARLTSTSCGSHPPCW